MLIYGDPKLWFWVRIQHLQFFEQVLDCHRGEAAHPCYELYKDSMRRGLGRTISILKRECTQLVVGWIIGELPCMTSSVIDQF